jgi:hypothetical protein
VDSLTRGTAPPADKPRAPQPGQTPRLVEVRTFLTRAAEPVAVLQLSGQDGSVTHFWTPVEQLALLAKRLTEDAALLSA